MALAAIFCRPEHEIFHIIDNSKRSTIRIYITAWPYMVRLHFECQAQSSCTQQDMLPAIEREKHWQAELAYSGSAVRRRITGGNTTTSGAVII
jgi:hypothetical protein